MLWLLCCGHSKGTAARTTCDVRGGVKLFVSTVFMCYECAQRYWVKPHTQLCNYIVLVGKKHAYPIYITRYKHSHTLIYLPWLNNLIVSHTHTTPQRSAQKGDMYTPPIKSNRLCLIFKLLFSQEPRVQRCARLIRFLITNTHTHILDHLNKGI